jgi:hypothetical protein
MNYILWMGKKLFMNPTFFNKGLQLKIIWSSSLIFSFLIQTFAPKHIPLRYSNIIKIKSITLFWSFIFFLSTPYREYSFSRVHQNFAIQFALLVYGRYVYITHKDTPQRFIHINIELSCITQNFYESHYKSYSIMASYLLKWVFAILMHRSFKDKYNTIGDNLASHNIQQVMIYNTSTYWSVSGVYLLEWLLQILHQNHNL